MGDAFDGELVVRTRSVVTRAGDSGMNTGDAIERKRSPPNASTSWIRRASGDFNPIHWSESRQSCGVADVTPTACTRRPNSAAPAGAGMGDPGRIPSFSVRFSAPVVVPTPRGADLEPLPEVVDVERMRRRRGRCTRPHAAWRDVVKDAVAPCESGSAPRRPHDHRARR